MPPEVESNAGTGSVAAPPRPPSRMRGRIRSFEPPLRPMPHGYHYAEFETADGRRVFIHHEVLADLRAIERAEHPNETAGLLFGRTFTDGANQCALVRHLIRPRVGEVIGTPVTVTITAEGSSRMSRRAQECHPCADAVGWAHTHPTFGAYFSGTDRAEQAIWTSPASVGLVISGLPEADPRYEVFVGPESTPTSQVGRAATTSRSRSRLSAASVEPIDTEAHDVRRPAVAPFPSRGGRDRPRRRIPSPRILREISTAAAAILIVLLVWLASGWISGSDEESRVGDSQPPAGRIAPPLLPDEMSGNGIDRLSAVSTLVEKIRREVAVLLDTWSTDATGGNR